MLESRPNLLVKILVFLQCRWKDSTLPELDSAQTLSFSSAGKAGIRVIQKSPPPLHVLHWSGEAPLLCVKFGFGGFGEPASLWSLSYWWRTPVQDLPRLQPAAQRFGGSFSLCGVQEEQKGLFVDDRLQTAVGIFGVYDRVGFGCKQATRRERELFGWFDKTHIFFQVLKSISHHNHKHEGIREWCS